MLRKSREGSHFHAPVFQFYDRLWSYLRWLPKPHLRLWPGRLSKQPDTSRSTPSNSSATTTAKS